ncbi:restriction endonuclease subunit S, partial [Enterococcus hirae]
KYFNSDYPEDYVLSEGDIVVTMTDLSKESDTLGYSAKIPSIKGKVLLHNQLIGLVEFIDNDVSRDYLYWLMRTAEYQWY